MKTSIKQFLSDLYEIDPSLKEHQAELVPLLEQLLAKDPATAPDAHFVARLRSQLQERAAAADAPVSSVWQKFAYAFGGALTVAVVLPLAVILTNQHPAAPGTPLFSNSVQATNKNAFGALSDINATTDSANRVAAPEASRPQSGGGGGEGTMNATSAIAPYGMTDQKMIAPWPMIEYQYVYSGSLTGLASTVSVYKRNTQPLNVSMSTLASSLNLGGLNLGSFNGMNIDSVSFTQKQKFGYQMYVNLRDASVSIDANWEQWPQSTCQTDACYQAERTKISDIPEDSELIAIAQAFAKDHGIDLTGYGTPEVDNGWRREYVRATDKSAVYIPDTQRVIFPQLIDGKIVYDQSGIKTGLSISVNVKYKKVMSVWGIGDHSYLASEYAGVTDESVIQKFLTTVDNYFYGEPTKDTKKVTVVLGTPTVSYSVYYRYTDNKNEELLVPALIFPVDHVEGNTTENMYYRSSVVVPLAQDMLNEQSDRPVPMPFMMKEGAVEDQAAPAAVVNPVTR